MDYVYYILFVLGIMALCLMLIRLPGRMRLNKNQAALSDRARNRAAKSQRLRRRDKKQKKHDHEVILRELAKVPTPWGWPGHHEAVPHLDHHYSRVLEAEQVSGISESLHRFVDRLLREKSTVDSAEYQMRKDACLRAMVEDRFGHPVDMKEVNYRKVKPPLLRDPSQPHDQMDNFASGKTSKIIERLGSQPSLYEKQLIYKNKTRLKEIKKPWGW